MYKKVKISFKEKQNQIKMGKNWLNCCSIALKFKNK